MFWGVHDLIVLFLPWFLFFPLLSSSTWVIFSLPNSIPLSWSYILMVSLTVPCLFSFCLLGGGWFFFHFYFLDFEVYLFILMLLSLLLAAVRGTFNKFPDIFVQAFKIVVDSWKFTMLLLYNFYDFRFKWAATAAIGIHLTKAWLSQLVNFKNAIWTWGHFRRTICNRIVL